MRVVVNLVIPLTLTLERRYPASESLGSLRADVIGETERTLEAVLGGAKQHGVVRRKAKVESIQLREEDDTYE